MGIDKPDWAREVRQLPTSSGMSTYPAILDSWLNWKWQLGIGDKSWERLNQIKSNPEIVQKAIGKPTMLDGEMNSRNFIDLIRVFKGMAPGGECPLCQGYQVANWGLGPQLCYCSILDKQRDDYHEYRRFESPKKKGNDLSSFKTTGPNQKIVAERNKMLVAAKRFLVNPDKWLLYIGEPGTGKTHILQGVASEYNGIAFYFRCQDLANIYRQLKDGSFDDFRWILRNIPVLLLDDYGSQYGTEFINSVLLDVIDFRMNNYDFLPTIISTNLTMGELMGSETTDNYARLCDRITDTDYVNIIESPHLMSYRQTHS